MPVFEPPYWVSVHHAVSTATVLNPGEAGSCLRQGDRGRGARRHDDAWMSDVVACSDGTESKRESDPEARRIQNSAAILLHSIGPLRRGRELAKIVFESRPELPAGRSFDRLPSERRTYQYFWAASVIEEGVVIDPRTEKAAIPGVYVAGDSVATTSFLSRSPAEERTGGRRHQQRRFASRRVLRIASP